MKGLAPQDRPREKLARAGAAALGDNELVALLVGSGSRERSALEVAHDVLEMTGGVAGLLYASVDELRRVAGVGSPRASRLVAAIELGRRAVAGAVLPRPQFLNPIDLGHYLMSHYSGHPLERFGALLLDSRNRLIKSLILSSGSVDASIAHPGEVFREAAIVRATAIVAFHNHPSGDPRPSASDIKLTQRLKSAGEIMGIDLIDHVVLGDRAWFSFRDGNLL